MAVPLKGLYREIMGPFHGQQRMLDDTTSPCADMELNYVECLEAYGFSRGQSMCHAFKEDYLECTSAWKTLWRSTLMRTERYKQLVKGERKQLFESDPPYDSYIKRTFVP